MSRWGSSCAWEKIDGRIRQAAGCRLGHGVSDELSGCGLGVSKENVYFETTLFPLLHTAYWPTDLEINFFEFVNHF